MGEYRERTTAEVKSQGQWRADFPTMSLPRVWKAATLDAMNLDAVLASPAATVGAYQISVRDGVEQDSKGNWVEKYTARDMFADYTDEDGVSHTKSEQEAAYQATLDANTAEAHRATRNKLLSETDWISIKARELGQPIPQDWYDYRGDLRQIPEQEGFPHNITWPTKPQ